MDCPGEKLLLKLWETLAEKGVGSLLQPWHEKRLAKARYEIRREEMLVLAQADKEVNEIKAGKAICYLRGNEIKLLATDANEIDEQGRIEPKLDFPSIALRASEVDIADSVRKEINVSRAVMVAEDILAADKQEPPNSKIEDDWLFSWRDYAGKVSTEELQDLWGRVLAGELKQPGTYSVRTLEFLKNLSKEEAELISKAARFVIGSRIFRNKDQFLEKEGISFTHLMYLQDIGVVSGVESLGLTTTYKSLNTDKYLNHLIASNKIIILEHEDHTKAVSTEIYLLTRVGEEVLKLASFQVNEDYLEAVARDFVAKGVNVKIADWVQQTAEYGNFFNAREINA